MALPLQPIPAKRYFTIGEVGELCDVKPHVLRYWEQEFTQLRPMKRRGNRRYYQRHEVLMIRRIRELLYDHGFTISGARNKLQEAESSIALGSELPDSAAESGTVTSGAHLQDVAFDFLGGDPTHALWLVKRELFEIRDLLSATR